MLWSPNIPPPCPPPSINLSSFPACFVFLLFLLHVLLCMHVCVYVCICLCGGVGWGHMPLCLLSFSAAVSVRTSSGLAVCIFNTSCHGLCINLLFIYSYILHGMHFSTCDALATYTCIHLLVTPYLTPVSYAWHCCVIKALCQLCHDSHERVINECFNDHEKLTLFGLSLPQPNVN